MANLQTITKKGIGPRWMDRLACIQWSTRPRLLLALFCILGAILVAPVWTVKYPPLVDFPNHLASSFVLAHLHDPRFQFSRFYAPHWNLGPYLAMDLILVALLKILPAMLAGRIFLSLCLLAIPPAVWFFLREANPGEERLAFWSLLLCSNVFFFLYGLLELQLSFAICFLALGLWLRYLKRPRASRWWLLCALITTLYFTHIGGFVVAGVVITSYLITGRQPIRVTAKSWLLFFPGSALYLYWKLHDAGSWPIRFWTVKGKVGHMVAVMRGYSTPLDFLTLVVILGCIFLACADNPQLRWNRPWLVVLLCLLLIYMLVPGAYGPGNMADQRLLPFIFVIALAGARIGRRGIYLVPIALALFVLRSANVEKNFVLMQPHLKNLARSFSVIPENARILPIIHKREDAGTPDDYFWGYGVIDRGWFSPYLFHDPGVQPIQIRLKTYTMPHYGAFVAPPRSVEWSKIRSDYDYIWAYEAPIYSRQMAGIGKLILDSGGLQVYQLTKPADDHHPEAKSKLTPRQ